MVHIVMRLLCCALAMNPSARAKRFATVSLPSGPHKCVITWPGKEGAPESSVSFGVSNCRTQCLSSNGDYRYTKMFALVFSTSQGAKKCGCHVGGRELFQMLGECPGPEDAGAKCFRQYLREVTDELKAETEYNRESLRLIPHEELYHELTFNYSTCITNGCEGNSCLEGYLPSWWDTLTDDEKKLVGAVVAKAALQGVKELTHQQRRLINQIGPDDFRRVRALVMEEASTSEDPKLAQRLERMEDQVNKGDIIQMKDEDSAEAATLGTDTGAEDDQQVAEDDQQVTEEDQQKAFELLVNAAGHDGLTVAELKKAYRLELNKNSILKTVSVEHMAAVAGLDDPEQVVTFDDYKRFVEPHCP